jgi:hypothetical protein
MDASARSHGWIRTWYSRTCLCTRLNRRPCPPVLLDFDYPCPVEADGQRFLMYVRHCTHARQFVLLFAKVSQSLNVRVKDD